jgi:GNAT superfamily N-acetyltransferase
MIARAIRPAMNADAAFMAEGLIDIARSVRDRAGSAYNRLLPEDVTPREFEYVLEFLKGGNRLALIAELDGCPVGFLLAESGAGAVPSLSRGLTGTISACHVEPVHRRTGVAQALVDRAETWFRAQGVRYAELSFGADSESAGPAWEAIGYAPFRIFSVKDLGTVAPPSVPGSV